jgi:hypothetical protein
MNAITKIQLDVIAAGGCTDPNCKEPHHGEKFFLHSKCHPAARCEVSYTRGSGVLVVSCAECHQVLAPIAVKEA